MKRLAAFLMVVCLLTAGCDGFGKKATVESARDFVKALAGTLGQKGEPDRFGHGRGQAGNIYTQEFSFDLPPDQFPPGMIGAAGDVAMTKWGQLDSYNTSGHGGGSSNFHMHYGTDSTHAFIDVIAYPERGNTHVVVLLRVLE